MSRSESGAAIFGRQSPDHACGMDVSTWLLAVYTICFNLLFLILFNLLLWIYQQGSLPHIIWWCAGSAAKKKRWSSNPSRPPCVGGFWWELYDQDRCTGTVHFSRRRPASPRGNPKRPRLRKGFPRDWNKYRCLDRFPSQCGCWPPVDSLWRIEPLPRCYHAAKRQQRY